MIVAARPQIRTAVSPILPRQVLGSTWQGTKRDSPKPPNNSSENKRETDSVLLQNEHKQTSKKVFYECFLFRITCDMRSNS